MDGVVPTATASGTSTKDRTAATASARLPASRAPLLRTKPDHCTRFVLSSAKVFESATGAVVGRGVMRRSNVARMARATVSLSHTMALVSRTLGGARASDLHAWDWAHVDTAGWVDAHVPRPKTKSGDRMLLPDVLVPVLRAWWDSHGRPSAGPVFPCRRGARAGQRKGKGISYAAALRDALWAAKVIRPLPGFERAATDAERRRLCLIQAGSAEHRPLDFHSFRRAYNTALADANVNVQTAMRLAGHRNASTHMRYVMRTGRLATPTAALPALANIGSGRAAKHRVSIVVDAEPQSTNGTSTAGQSAVFTASSGLASDRELVELIVGHEGLEPSTNGLRIHCSTN